MTISKTAKSSFVSMKKSYSPRGVFTAKRQSLPGSRHLKVAKTFDVLFAAKSFFI